MRPETWGEQLLYCFCFRVKRVPFGFVVKLIHRKNTSRGLKKQGEPFLLLFLIVQGPEVGSFEVSILP